jgi:hypothetical protein
MAVGPNRIALKPVPATANLIAGVPVYSSAVKGELVTPTGAAIIATLAQQFSPLPTMALAAGIGKFPMPRESICGPGRNQPCLVFIVRGKPGQALRYPALIVSSHFSHSTYGLRLTKPVSLFS